MSVAPRPGDRELVSLLQPLARGEQFRHWPLHFTLMPWFRTQLSNLEVQELIAEALREFQPFSVTMGGIEHFGFHDKVPVRVVETPNTFEQMHQRVLQAFSDHPQITILDTQHTGKNFRAHVTLHGYEPLREGDIVACNDVQIVHLADIHPGGSTKQVESEVDIGA